MKINNKEIENVSKLKPFKRYQYFIKKVIDFEELWTLLDNEDNLAMSHVDEKMLVSFWTNEAFIKSNLDENWKGFKPFKLTLDYFEDKIIPIVAENNYLLNIFPVGGMSGFVVNLDEFIRDLNNELEKYQ